jgi:hypothetical protein
MPDERLAQMSVAALSPFPFDHPATRIVQDAFAELAAEAKRARGEEERIRRQLGEARLEWGVRIFDHDPANAVEVMSDETQAREVAACWRDEIDGSNPTLMQRTMRSEGQWRAG